MLRDPELYECVRQQNLILFAHILTLSQIRRRLSSVGDLSHLGRAIDVSGGQRMLRAVKH